MWRIIFLIFIAVGVFFILQPSPAQSPVLGVEELVATVAPEMEYEYTIEFSGIVYKLNMVFADTSNLLLIPNFTEKKIAKNVYKEQGCKLLVNGGFYSKDNKPIGLFISNRKKISDFAKNSLFNGFLTVNYFDTPRITSQLPQDQLTISLQTGPILQENDIEHVLKLVRDKAARRVIAATTGENELLFIALYRQDTVFSGPFLKDLPAIVSQFEDEAGIKIADAINLDGGAASALFYGDLALSEASPVGSFFCVK